MADYETYLAVKHDLEMRAKGYVLFASKTLKNHTYWQLGHIHDIWCYDIFKEWRKPKTGDNNSGGLERQSDER